MQAFSSLVYRNVCSNGSLTDSRGEWAALCPSIKSGFVEESTFARHLEALHQRVDLITLARVKRFFAAPLISRQEASCPDVRPSTLLTFDGGWRGTLDLAVPILQRYAAEATVFITPSLLDTPGFLKASELHNLPSALRIGSHCQTHRFLNEMTDAEIREELRVSKHELEQLSDQAVDTVSISDDVVDHRVQRIAHELGYALIFTSEVQLNSLWSGPANIGRAAMQTATTADMATDFAEGNFGIEPIRQMVLSLPQRVLGPGRYRRMRAWWMGENLTEHEMLVAHGR